MVIKKDDFPLWEVHIKKSVHLSCWCRPAYTPIHHPEHAPYIYSQNFSFAKNP